MFEVKHFILLSAAMLIMACSPKGADPTQVEADEREDNQGEDTED